MNNPYHIYLNSDCKYIVSQDDRERLAEDCNNIFGVLDPDMYVTMESKDLWDLLQVVQDHRPDRHDIVLFDARTFLIPCDLVMHHKMHSLFIDILEYDRPTKKIPV